MVLKGIKVLEFAGMTTVPFCGMILSDFGASVIRVDKVNGEHPYDVLSNGKRSISVNIKTPQGLEIIKHLAQESDILIEPFQPGFMEKFNLSPKELMRINPKLIYARLTGYGQSGCYHKKHGYDINYLALSGLLSMFNKGGEKPSYPLNFAADFAGGGVICTLGILLALFERTKSGIGQVIDSSILEGTSYIGSWLFRSQNLPIWEFEKGKNVLDGGSHYYNIYETKDKKYISVAPLEPELYKELLNGLELNEVDTPQSDFKKGKLIFTKKFKQKTRAEWCAIFDNRDACVAPVLSYREAPQNVHSKELKSYVIKDDVIYPQPAPRLSRTPGQPQIDIRTLKAGDHTVEILKELNYSDAKIERLKRVGAVSFKKQKPLHKITRTINKP